MALPARAVRAGCEDAGVGRPRVVTSNVASVDGRLTIAPGVLLLAGDERWSAIAGQANPYAWIRAEHDPDVLLEGSGSFVPTDARPVEYPPYPGDPAPLYRHHLPAEVVRAPDRRWLAVVDGRGRVRLRYTEWPDPAWAGWHVLALACRATPAAHLAWLRESGIPYLVAGSGSVDLGQALRLLQDELGVHTVVCTGGGRLGGALLRAGLVDEVDVEVLPAAIGGRGTPALFDAAPLGPSEPAVPLRLLGSETTGDGHLRLRYAVRGN